MIDAEVPVTTLLAIILVATPITFLAWAAHSRSKYQTDPKAAKRFKLALTGTAASSLLAVILVAGYHEASKGFIEPAGGISTDSSRDTDYRDRNRRDPSPTQAPAYTQSQPPQNNPSSTDASPPGQQDPATETLQDTADRWGTAGVLASVLRRDRIIVHTANAKPSKQSPPYPTGTADGSSAPPTTPRPPGAPPYGSRHTPSRTPSTTWNASRTPSNHWTSPART